jgi:CHAD domain-containing protein
MIGTQYMATTLDSRITLKEAFLSSYPLQKPTSIRTGHGDLQAAGDDKSALSRPLDPALPAARVLAHLLLNLLGTMERSENGIREDKDPAALHEFRVACRRSRTLLSQVKQVLPSDDLRRFKAAFAWLSTMTSSCRDLDVFLSYLDHMVITAGVDTEADLDRLRDILRNEQRQARAQMLRALRSKRYRRFKSDWHELLEHAFAGEIHASHADLPVKKVADASIWRVYCKLLKYGEEINAASGDIRDIEPATLHELRKTGKKLRYLLEAFADLYPPEEIRNAIKSLKKLQDNLGNIVDANVQAQTLQLLAARPELQAEGSILRTLHVLLGDCGQRHHDYLADFPRHFDRFTTRSKRKCFKQLFKPGK